MKLTRLRIVGFKSFVDPSEIHIEPGLTGIVGPNGCGKSNLVEAVRWVMGESSHKSLRASGMDDVIFSGSGSRPSRNSAEVALVIDNSARRAPAQFNDADVLEVSRRIEREAGSVYKINGKDTRARDVQLLFADASTGAHSPAMVRQGQIGELISAKPRDRRKILEEAAGIAGLHSRRHEAELRLRAAEQNMARLDDVIAQLAQQLDSLKRQARQASRYKALSADIRKTEAILWHLRRQAALQAITDREAAVREAAAIVAGLTQAAAAAATARTEATSILPALREKEAEVAARLRHLTVTRDGIDREKRQVLERREELGGRLSQISADLERERATIASTNETIQRLDEEEAEIKAEAERAEANGEELKRRLSATETTLQEAEARLAEATANAAELTARRRQFERIVRDESDRLAKLEKQLADIEREAAALASSDTTREIAALSAAVDAAQAEVESREAATVEADQALTAARDALEAARAPTADAERDLKGLETEHRTLERVLAVDDGALWPPLIDAVTVRRGFEAALGAAFGEDLDHPAEDGAAIHWSMVAPDAADPALPAGARPMSEVVKAPDVLARALSQVGLVEHADGARLQTQLKPGQRLVTKSGDLWRWDGFTAAADAPTAAAKRLEQRNRVAELAREIEAARGRLETARTTLADNEAAARTAAEQATAARDASRAARGHLKDASERRSAAERKATQDTARSSALEEAKVRITQSIEEARATHREASAGLKALAGQGDPDARIELLKAETATARGQYAEARSAVDSLAKEADLRRTRAERNKAERRRWSDRIADGDKHLNTLAAREDQIRREWASLEEVPARLDARRAALANEIDAAEAARKAAADALATGDTRLTEADRVAKEADETLAGAREAKAREEATLEGLRQRLVDLEESIEEALERPADQALAVAGLDAESELPPADKLEADHERYKRDRDRLGSVNLRAEEEMREVETRHDALTTERGDLEGAIHRLRGAIGGLNREGRERLLAAFDTVNGHFQSLFTRLFGGGAAELKLTESDDPLEAGLEIIARPPGKRPSSLTLLSGGEQALTATALIFAVFLTNPAPICVLDEVDAPLDDANVERFCDLVEEIARSTETRFLVITHNPISMARMDRLFGVTMAERGVSQLVSVDFGGAMDLREAG
ncbi:chromosome segregation protein SMC [Microbaculum marinisediminis]|uniref:Chromosome partition protein Smc n=1 Tax=Microbaculum marinisediminis TaxID=2931392 RepID=A0AAW5QR33_9HYPH|nr:chromosome segregation protein SMC [Microbaculum sp. A6E488]MCT8970322.1 chromosome segregation protein SMC [Microbaculum sp. A6E488]